MIHYQVSEDRNEHKVKVVFLFVHTSQGIFITTLIYFTMREEYGKACAQPKLVAIHFGRTIHECKHDMQTHCMRLW